MNSPVGIASGRKRALEAIVAYAQMQRVVLRETSGAIIGWEAFLQEPVPISDGRKRPVRIALLLLGLGVMVGLVGYV